MTLRLAAFTVAASLAALGVGAYITLRDLLNAEWVKA